MQLHKKTTIILVALVALMLPNACQKDKLDQEPKNLFGETAIFDTPDRFLSLANGLYDAMKSGNFYGGRYIVYGDIRCEEFLNETGNGVTGLQTWNHTLVESSNEVNNLWSAAYSCINSCNIYIEGVEANKAVLKNDALAANYIAEARFLRAVCYHSMLQLYARPYADGNGSKPGLPLRLRAETKDGNNDLERSTVAQVYDQILADLDFASANLPDKYSSGLLNVTRAHKNTAIAFKTRVLMAMGRYADVVTEANKIVPTAAPFKAATGVAHELQAKVKDVFTTPYTTTESIFSMPFTSNDLPGTQNGLGSYYNPGPRGIGDFSMNKAGIIGDSVNFKAVDARRQFTLVSGAKVWLNKFPAGAEHTDYAPVIRYAEVLLNAAEAIARTAGVDARAIALLNAVHGRSEPSTVYTAADFADGAALVSAVMRERRIELLGEGLRSFDNTRLLTPLPGKANVATINPDSKDYIWPIPSSELLANKLCKQN